MNYLNDGAIKALSNTDSLINNLYAVSLECPNKFRSDSVHFYTDGGTKLFGKKVLGFICKELEISLKDINIENFVPERYSNDNIGY